MKIALFTDTYYPEINGVATSCLNLQRELTRQGHEVHVYAPQCKGYEAYASDTIHYLPSKPLAVLKDRNVAKFDKKALQEAASHHFDIVHTNSEFMMGFAGRKVGKACGSAMVHTYHTVWEDYTYYITKGHLDGLAKSVTRWYSGFWCNKFNRVITPTAKTSKLLRGYGVKTDIDIIPSGMNIARFAPELHSAENHEAIRKECGVRPGERVLLNIGRLAKEKNMEQIMRVFPKLHERFPDVRFVIVGEGPQKELLGKMAQELGVGDSVTLTGPKPWEKIDQYYSIGDVFVSASHSETQGLTYVEAMASGVCVCAINDPCLDGVIEDGVSGILTGDSDEELLAGLTRAFGDEGRNIAAHAAQYAAPFSTEAFARKVEQCYKKALDGRNAG